MTSTPEIVKCFQDFYGDLYRSKTSVPREESLNFLRGITLPTLEEDDRKMLDGPIELEELQEAVQGMPNNKAPGPDGLPIEIYKKYGGLLLPELLKTMQDAFETTILPPSMREATVVVLPKPGKDPLLPDSYRPISLLAVDIKILAKVLASRLAKIIHKLIHPDQSGFIPNRSTAPNIRRLYLNLQIPTLNMGQRAVLSLDAAKAFDSVEWDHLWNTLDAFGFGPTFIKWVKILYTLPTAKLRINNSLSDPLLLYRGTRQGCPLSPLLFALALEPLACAVRQHPGIRGFDRCLGTDKIALYADDTLLFLGDTCSSLENVMSLIETYGSFSGYKINWSKSVLMPIDSEIQRLQGAAAPITIAHSFKYLGIVISKTIQEYIAQNMNPLLEKFKNVSKTWCKLPLSVVGRINLIKMVWMPQLLYILHNSPIWLPISIFQRIDSLFRELIWKGKISRIRLYTLMRPKDAGGMTVPHAKMYFLASQLQHIAGWATVSMLDPIQLILRSELGDMPLAYALEGGLFRNRHLHPTLTLIHNTWRAMKSLMKHEGFTSYMPIWNNHSLSELAKLQKPLHWRETDLYSLSQLFTQQAVKSLSVLEEEFNIPKNSHFHYLQIVHAINAQKKIGPLTYAPLPLWESIVTKQDTKKGMISAIYNSLLKAFLDSRTTPCFAAWEREFGELDSEDWEEIMSLAPKVSLSPSHRLTQLFVFHRIYYTPLKLFKWGRRDSADCPRCLIHTGSFIHMMWRCPKLTRYWQEVYHIINSVFQINMDVDPKSGLLGLLPTHLQESAHTEVIIRLLFQARKQIALKWLSTALPTKLYWLNTVNSLLEREKLVYVHRGCPHKFMKVWSEWISHPSAEVPGPLRDRLLSSPDSG